jgi:hypothetical protein
MNDVFPYLTENECVEAGGHCYEMSPEVLCSIPPQYVRVCKHWNGEAWVPQTP